MSTAAGGRRATAPVRGLVHRLPPARGAARAPPRPAVALPDPHLHAGRAAGHAGSSRPAAAARRLRRAARRPALRARADRARRRAVRNPGRAAAARRAGPAGPAGRRTGRDRRARRRRARRGLHRTAVPGRGRGRLARAVRHPGRDPAAAGRAQKPQNARAGHRARGGLDVAPPAGLRRHDTDSGPGRRDGLERPPPHQPVPYRDRADAEGRGPGHPLRPGPAPAGSPGPVVSGPAGVAGYRLADLAVACGYFDQAHLAREFRALAGCPPSQWLAEEFRNVQAGAWLFRGKKPEISPEGR